MSDDGRARQAAPRLGTAAFLAVQVLIVSLAVGWAAHRVREQDGERALPALRNQPREVLPEYDDAEVVSDAQLRAFLARLGLPSKGAGTNIGAVDHSLRMWGANQRFDDPELMSSAQMRRLLVDHSRFVEVLGADRPPLLLDDGEAIRFRTQEGLATSSHYDHTLATLAEIGTPLDFPVVTPRRRATLRAVLEQALRDFSLNQAEYEWSALSFALYLEPVAGWFTTEGQWVSFDRIADRIMRETLSRGVCAGNHRLYALTSFLRLDEQIQAGGDAPMLSPEARAKIVDHLRGVTASFVRHQHVDGFWNGDWPTSTPPSSEPGDEPMDSMNTRLIVTGHVLEWWALAPPELHPPHPVLTAAGQWLVRTVEALSDQEVERYYSFLSHAGRALALWRGRLPGEVDLATERRPEDPDEEENA